MKRIMICILGLAILAASCVYEPDSREPSSLAGLLALTGVLPPDLPR